MSQKMQKPSALPTEEPQGNQEPLLPSKDKNGGGTKGNLTAKSRRFAGSLEGAQILQRLFFWQPRSTITRGGKSWVVFSQERWLEETGCTRGEFNRGLRKLKDRGVIELERHLFANKTRSFIRIQDGALDDPCDHAGQLTGDHGLIIAGDHEPMTTGDHDPMTTKKEEVKKEVRKEQKKEHLCKQVCGTVSDGVKKAPGEGSNQSNEKDVLASIQEKFPVTKPNTVTDLEMQWKKFMSEEYGHVMVKVTQKMRGQMKHFISFCPPGKASEIFANTLAKWDEFGSDAQHAAGLKTFPNEPNIGFMLAHSAVAVKLFNGPDTYAAPKKPATLPWKAAPVKMQPKPEDDDPMPTLAEILAPPKIASKGIEPPSVPGMPKLSGKMVKFAKKPS